MQPALLHLCPARRGTAGPWSRSSGRYWQPSTLLFQSPKAVQAPSQHHAARLQQGYSTQHPETSQQSEMAGKQPPSQPDSSDGGREGAQLPLAHAESSWAVQRQYELHWSGPAKHAIHCLRTMLLLLKLALLCQLDGSRGNPPQPQQLFWNLTRSMQAEVMHALWKLSAHIKEHCLSGELTKVQADVEMLCLVAVPVLVHSFRLTILGLHGSAPTTTHLLAALACLTIIETVAASDMAGARHAFCKELFRLGAVPLLLRTLSSEETLANAAVLVLDTLICNTPHRAAIARMKGMTHLSRWLQLPSDDKAATDDTLMELRAWVKSMIELLKEDPFELRSGKPEADSHTESSGCQAVNASPAPSCTDSDMQLQSLQAALSSYLKPPIELKKALMQAEAASAANTGGRSWKTPTAAVWQEVELIAIQALHLLAWANHQLLEFEANGDKADTKKASVANLLKLKEASVHLMHDLLVVMLLMARSSFPNSWE